MRADARLLLLPVLLACGAAIVGAMRRTSLTFDEGVLVAGGARGFATGSFDLAPDHPPLLQYLYGLPAFALRPSYPPESAAWGSATRYAYAQQFFFGVGNDPERLAFAARLPAAVLAVALPFAVWLAARRLGEGTALLATALVAFLPDVLGHGGVAYGDVPLALAFWCALWACDDALRRPTVARGVAAGLATGLALAVKFSAIALVPAAGLMALAEAARSRDAEWRRRLGLAAAVGLATVYLVLVLTYRGDVALAGFREAARLKAVQASAAANSPAYLFGRVSRAGYWYFFPVAFFLKTPAALHLLIVLAVVGALVGPRLRLADAAASPLRAPLAGLAVFVVSLLAARKDIGFRYALPALPPLCLLAAAGLVRLLRRGPPRLRALVVALAVWHAGSALSVYPDFLAYLSEYVPRDRGYEALADSSLDWGQGLVALRDFMRHDGVDRVYLSYFGSALPEGYGIDYVALPSFFPLARTLPPGAPEPRLAVVSATNLAGVYLPGDPLADLRRRRPDRVLARTLFVYRLRD